MLWSVSYRKCAFVAAVTWTVLACADGKRTGVDSAPIIKDADNVEFYVIESSFPYNAPENIRSAAGDNFREYGITHGGIGVWDKTSDFKFTIEFVADDYVGALLPDLDEEARTLVWQNGGNVVFTSPSDESDWLNSQLICDATGVAYNQLISYIEDNAGLFASFQPVEVIHYNGTVAGDGTATGTVQVSKTESFWFVNRLVLQLSSYGADTESFLDIHATSYQYVARTELDPAVVSWSAEGAANADVYTWYQALSDCYGRVFNETEDGGGGADYFFETVKECYGDYAYVYLSDTSVYNVTLGNVSSTYSTPNLQRYVFALPDAADESKADLQPIDIIVIVAVALFIAAGAFVLLRTMCTKKKRRHISMEGEKVAQRTVDNIAGEHLHDDHEQKLYYRGRPTRWRRLWNFVTTGDSRGRHAGTAAAQADATLSGGSAHSRGLAGSVLGAGGGERGLHPNSNDSEPSSDLVTPLASRSEEFGGVGMHYLDRVAHPGGGYVSPSLAATGAAEGVGSTVSV